MYKLVVCNLGYDDIFLCNLDGKESDNLEELILDLEYDYCDSDEIDGYSITYKNFTPSEDGFNEDGTIDIIRTDDYDSCIYIRKVED